MLSFQDLWVTDSFCKDHIDSRYHWNLGGNWVVRRSKVPGLLRCCLSLPDHSIQHLDVCFGFQWQIVCLCEGCFLWLCAHTHTHTHVCEEAKGQHQVPFLISPSIYVLRQHFSRILLLSATLIPHWAELRLETSNPTSYSDTLPSARPHLLIGPFSMPKHSDMWICGD